jgi:hypothetical protein
MKKLTLIDTVKDTYTNVSGASLAMQIGKDVADKSIVEISLKNSTPISSSFFNSSFGDLIERLGYNTVKQYIKFKDVTESQGTILRSYFDAYKMMHS